MLKQRKLDCLVIRSTMWKFVVFFLLLVVFAVLAMPDEDDQEQWDNFKRKHNKKYSSNQAELHRRKLWREKRNYIKKHNDEYKKNIHTYELGENELADLTDDEIKQLKGTKVPPGLDSWLDTVGGSSVRFLYREGRQLPPPQVDWRQDSCMPPIRNQLQCGGCYAFAAVHPLEVNNCWKSGQMSDFSEQQIIDCTTTAPYYMLGCKGGWYGNAWDYMTKTGIALDSTYPYTNALGTCGASQVTKFQAISSWGYVTSMNETAMVNALATYGPLAISMNCTKNFDFYKGGVFSDGLCVNTQSSSQVNHAMNVVGYGTDPKFGPFWIVRNTWGTTWGINGYALIRRGNNACNIARYPAFATVP